MIVQTIGGFFPSQQNVQFESRYNKISNLEYCILVRVYLRVFLSSFLIQYVCNQLGLS